MKNDACNPSKIAHNIVNVCLHYIVKMKKNSDSS